MEHTKISLKQSKMAIVNCPKFILHMFPDTNISIVVPRRGYNADKLGLVKKLILHRKN